MDSKIIATRQLIKDINTDFKKTCKEVIDVLKPPASCVAGYIMSMRRLIHKD